MAVDRNRTKELVEAIDALFDDAMGKIVSEKVKNDIRRVVIGPALDEVKRLVSDSRPPSIYLVGRSGDGKSSLLNALVGRRVADVSDVRRCQTSSERYHVEFPKVFASWDIYDSRGIFDPDTTEGQDEKDAVAFLEDDLLVKNPDVILHVVAAKAVRNLKNDLTTFAEIGRNIKRKTGTMPKTLLVINQVDLLGDRSKWPPEEHPRKAGAILDTMDYLTSALHIKGSEPLDLNSHIKGRKLQDNEYIGIIPVCSYMDVEEQRDDRWNIDFLKDFIGTELPVACQLDFCQSQQRKELLMKMSSSIIGRFATIASGIGAIPIPVSDILLLTPLQLLLIALIGGLSCQPFSIETAKKYLLPSGGNVAVAIGLRSVAQQLVKLFPVVGPAISGGMAGASTWGIGKAAEAYFFLGVKLDPKDLASSWKGDKNE